MAGPCQDRPPSTCGYRDGMGPARKPPPPFGLDDKTYAQLWFYALPVLGFVVGLVAFVALMHVLPGAWWGALSLVAGVLAGAAVVRAGRALHRRLGLGERKSDDGRGDSR